MDKNKKEIPEEKILSEDKPNPKKKEASNEFLNGSKLTLKKSSPGQSDPLKEIGVDNIKEVTTMIAKFFLGINDAKADDKWNLMDGVYFVPFLKTAYKAVKDIDMIDDEIKDLDKKEVSEIREHVYGKVKEIFPELTDEVKEWIDDCTRTALMLLYCVNKGFKLLK